MQKKGIMQILQETKSGIKYILDLPDEDATQEETNKLLTNLISLLWEQSRS